MSILRADLHVHSCHSLKNGNLPFLKSRDCYSRPEDVYRAARNRGMDLVTITDHDTIDGCLEFLDEHPDADDFIVAEEVSCWFPSQPLELHLGVYGMTERLHAELQPLRRNVFDVTACLREVGVFFAWNHMLHSYHHQVPLSDYLRVLDEVPAVEGRNGTMLKSHNDFATALAQEWSGITPCGAPRALSVVGGSDAHTLRRVGRTWTEAPGRTRDEFFANIRLGRSRAAGCHGSASCVAGDAYGVIRAYLASLAGHPPRDHEAVHRALCLLFVVISLPGQFLPFAIACAGKAREAREVRRAATELASWVKRNPRRLSLESQV